MASAQVLPNPSSSSSKKGHLEAGKKRLEEFRKKKAEGRAKKAASGGQLQLADAGQHETFSQISEHVREGSISATDNTTVTNLLELDRAREGKVTSFPQRIVIGSSNGMHEISPVIINKHDSLLYDTPVQNSSKDDMSKLYEISIFSEPANDYYGHSKETNELSHYKESSIEPNGGILADGFDAFAPVHADSKVDGNNIHSSFNFEPHLGEGRSSSKFYSNHDISGADNANSPLERLGDVSTQNRLSFPSTSASISRVNGETTNGVKHYIPGTMDPDNAFGGRKIIESTSYSSNADSAPWHSWESLSTDVTLPIKSSPNQLPFALNDSGSISGRSRPSFLDSIGLPRVSSTHQKPFDDPQKAHTPISFINTNFPSTETYSSSSTKQRFSDLNSSEQSHKLKALEFGSEEFTVNSNVSSNVDQLPKLRISDHLHQDHELPTQKDGDFAALEQYIEELTQEKFSLQRALDTSRNLTESLASENSSLTESFNQQGQVVNQLKSDMERLQEEMNAQLITVESFKLEYMNAQLECNAADERAKILASEVIALEEKALRLRSNELKLEKQMDNVNLEISSYKRKVSLLERERQDFQSTIDALQEEKKLLHSKLRNSSIHGKVNTVQISSNKDASTSTDDLGTEHVNLVDEETAIAHTTFQNTLQDHSPSMVVSSDSSLRCEDGGSYLPDAIAVIPTDHLRMIENINTLVSEVELEKEELLRALRNEASNASKLKDMNKDLSQKLEAQTQRLELLTAQRIANENVPTKPVDKAGLRDTAEYADEGDEVVERVLGWIMKLFPGGPGRRRTSKLL